MSETPTPTPEAAADVDTDTAEATTETAETVAEATETDRVYDHTYVTRLRAEAAEARVKAKRADALAVQAVSALAAADGRLVDPDDLAFTEDLLTEDGTVDADKVAAAIDALIARKPHLAARRPTTPIPQGAQPEPESVSLAAMLRART